MWYQICHRLSDIIPSFAVISHIMWYNCWLLMPIKVSLCPQKIYTYFCFCWRCTYNACIYVHPQQTFGLTCVIQWGNTDTFAAFLFCLKMNQVYLLPYSWKENCNTAINTDATQGVIKEFLWPIRPLPDQRKQKLFLFTKKKINCIQCSLISKMNLPFVWIKANFLTRPLQCSLAVSQFTNDGFAV